MLDTCVVVLFFQVSKWSFNEIEMFELCLKNFAIG